MEKNEITKKKDGFVFYRSFYEAIKELNPDQISNVFIAICELALDEKESDLKGIEKIVYTMAKPQILANNKRYKNGLKGAEFGKMGGRPKTPKETPKKPQKNPKKTPKEKEKEKENVKDKDKDKDKDNVKYGELNNVLLTKEQYNILSEKYNNINDAIEILDTWLGTSGSNFKNKNHFAYFKSNSWVWERVENKKTSTTTKKEQTVFIEDGKFYIDDTMKEYKDVLVGMDDNSVEKCWKWIYNKFYGQEVSVDFIRERLKQFKQTEE